MNRFNERLTTDFQDFDFAHGYMEEFIATKLGAQLEKLRIDRGLTQKELASRAGMKQPRISVLESGEYEGWSFQTLIALAEGLDVGLRVCFTEFSDVIRDVSTFSPELLSVESRDSDLKILQKRMEGHHSTAQNFNSNFETEAETADVITLEDFKFSGSTDDSSERTVGI